MTTKATTRQPRPRRSGEACLAARQVIDSTSSFAQAFKLTEQIQVIKFLEDDSYANYTRHWIERMTPTGRANRSYNCLDNWGKPCPLCEVGDKPQAVVGLQHRPHR